MGNPRGAGGLGLLGLGGYGLGLCAIGVAGIAAPLLQGGGNPDADEVLAVPSTDTITDTITGDITGGARLDLEPQLGGAPGSVLFAAAAVRPRAVPVGSPVSTAGTPRAPIGDPATRTEFRPTLLLLPSGRTAPIRSSGLRSDGSLAVPDDPKVVGWWDGGSMAGEPFGGTVIAGHVDSLKYGRGALAELGRARRGAVLELRADGHRLRYRVTAVQKVPQARMTTETAAFRQDVVHRLVVITCGGPFDRARHRYLDNVVITAVPIR
jgi:hypothetical protein